MTRDGSSVAMATGGGGGGKDAANGPGGPGGSRGPGRRGRSPGPVRGHGHGAGPGCGWLKEPFVAVPAFPEPEVRAGLEKRLLSPSRAGPGRVHSCPPVAAATPPPPLFQPAPPPPSRLDRSRVRTPHSRPRCPTLPGAALFGGGGERGAAGCGGMVRPHGLRGGGTHTPRPLHPMSVMMMMMVGRGTPGPPGTPHHCSGHWGPAPPPHPAAPPGPAPHPAWSVLSPPTPPHPGAAPGFGSGSGSAAPPAPLAGLISHGRGRGEGDTVPVPVPVPVSVPCPFCPAACTERRLHHGTPGHVNVQL